MATFTTSCVFTELVPNPGYKEIIIETAATFNANLDHVQMTLVDHGISTTGFISINGYLMSATYGVVITDAPTTIVSSGVLTISGTYTDTYPAKRIYRVIGKSV